MKKGIVKFFNKDKGYGFIIEDETKKEIFFHVSGAEYDDIEKDDKVTFVTEETKKGTKAVNVRPK